MSPQSLIHIRRANLNQVLGDRYGGNRARLADAMEVSSSYLARMLVEDAVGAKAIGESLARRAEEAAGLPRYWLDVPHTDGCGLAEAGYEALTLAPAASVPFHLLRDVERGTSLRALLLGKGPAPIATLATSQATGECEAVAVGLDDPVTDDAGRIRAPAGAAAVVVPAEPDTLNQGDHIVAWDDDAAGYRVRLVTADDGEWEQGDLLGRIAEVISRFVPAARLGQRNGRDA